MFRASVLHRHLSLGMATVFAVQIFAIAFCFSSQATAAAATVTPRVMASTCPMGMDVSAQTRDKAPCAYCDLPDTGALAVSLGSLSVDLPLVAVLADYWPVQEAAPQARGIRIAQAQAPPHSAALLYQTSSRIRL